MNGSGGNHGSLTAADAVVPVGFGYPIAADDDTTLDLPVSYLEGLGDRIPERAEAESTLRFLLSAPLGGMPPAQKPWYSQTAWLKISGRNRWRR